MVIFHSYVNVYQRVIPLWKGLTPGDPQPAMKTMEIPMEPEYMPMKTMEYLWNMYEISHEISHEIPLQFPFGSLHDPFPSPFRSNASSHRSITSNPFRL